MTRRSPEGAFGADDTIPRNPPPLEALRQVLARTEGQTTVTLTRPALVRLAEQADALTKTAGCHDTRECPICKAYTSQGRLA